MKIMQAIREHRGVTLIELMVVVAIVAILAAIAYPSYTQSVLKSHRTDAKVALMSTAEILEKCFTRFNQYRDNTAAPGQNCPTANQLEGSGSITVPNGTYLITGTPGINTFTLTATPQGGQANDTMCGNLTLDNTNKRDRTGTAPIGQCW